MKKPTVLITTYDRDLEHTMRQQSLGRGFEVISAHGEKSTVDLYREKNPDVVVFETSNGRGRHGMMVAEQLRRENGTLPLILITADGSEDLAVAALRAGVNNYLKLPVSEDELIKSIRRLLPGPFTSGDGAHGPPVIVGESFQIQEIKSDMAKLAAADTTVFITGETGTGKDLVAELLHEAMD